ncbi:DUF2161 family putative PD-(D/E)XK-type phosphodiesterase [Hoeflea sp. G2-23]|uniref:DUF2161 family putative PD-(D/E)XK-type phosphodiesterase n=1 Tax=Hoeflea algicola TaxID=2983763 RepID=A0ABT3Z3X9_9HYPH|nr:DUF2161 family putative PD-(D/E)XK-type phosphodiesterase [Hoeflea algicola]MCY0146473.1 DUF2161 family putative PD-(D/E)XK-type phosphodiesterase [Hoeflea algicola]
MSATRPRETDLYPPVKALLESQGYEVKGEIGAADVVAVRDGGEPLVVELKTSFSLSLFHQAIERQAITDVVYIAVPRGSGRAALKSLKVNTSLCRRLGLGLMTVRLKDGLVEVHADPSPYKPRKSAVKKTRLLREFAKRTGDPNSGGATRQGLMTAYRQDALRCARVLLELGPTKAALVAKTSGVEKARALMADNHYGWFERVATGIYAVCPKGAQALEQHGDPDAGTPRTVPAED